MKKKVLSSLSFVSLFILLFYNLSGCGEEGIGTVIGALPDPAELFQWSTKDKLVGYSHSADLYATETFHAGASVPLGKISMPLLTYEYAGKKRSIDDYMEREKVAGLLVLKNGKIALERYGPGIDKNTIWEMKSVGKSVVSTLIGIALKEGKIGSLNDAVDTYIPELKGSAYEGVTILNLLRMTSGVEWNESPYGDPTSDSNYILAHCIGTRTEGCTLERILSLKRAIDPQTNQPAEQGNLWHYSTGEAYLSGLLLERATGKSIAQYLEEKIWKPAKMEHDGVWILESDGGTTFGGIGFNATLRDCGRFGQFILNNGVLPDGSNLLPPNWVKDATTWSAPSAIPYFADNGQYGYMWWFYPAWDDGINNASPLMTKTEAAQLQNTTAPGSVQLTGRTSDWTFSAYGIYGQLIAINQLENVVVVQWSTWEAADPVDLGDFPANPYNEESVFVNAVIDALHD
jgi:CubicO group peptidase (beta-lactamase class C family)